MAGEAAICVATSAFTGAFSFIDPARARPFKVLSRSPHAVAKEATNSNTAAESAVRAASLFSENNFTALQSTT